MAETSNIRVVCRFRPQNSRELAEGGVPIVSFDDDMTSVKCDSKEYGGTFAFDRIFDWTASQRDVFGYSADSIIKDIMSGFNGTIFAYGQTGSGKTHTMMGDMERDELKGLTPRIVEKIFATILNSPPNLEFTVKVSFMEIYMERIRDLLNPAKDNLPVHEDKGRGVYVKGLLEVFVGSVDEVYEAMRRGQSSRVVAYTSGQDGCHRPDARGAKKINKSLSALGMVINALTDGKSSHIPYRDSKLTRILQESLGGNSRTTLIINASPSSFNEDETISTLRFGMRAKTIKNKAKVNAELSPSELKVLLKAAKIEVSSLQNQVVSIQTELVRWRAGQTVPEAEWAQLSSGLSADATVPTSAAASSPEMASRTSPVLASVAAVAVSDDEREEFLRRENELSDQLAEKESELKKQEAFVAALQDELAALRAREAELLLENAGVTEMKLRLDKALFDKDESVITIDALKEAKSEVERELDTLKQQILELQASKLPEASNEEDEKEKKRSEKMAQMMAEFDPTSAIDDNEKQIRETLSKLAHMTDTSSPPPTDPDTIAAQHYELLDTKAVVARQAVQISELSETAAATADELATLRGRKEELESKLASLEAEYEQLLEKTIQEEEQHFGGEMATVVADLKAKLEVQYNAKREIQEGEIQDLQIATAKKDEEIARLQKMLAEQTKTNEELSSSVELLRKAAPVVPSSVTASATTSAAAAAESTTPASAAPSAAAPAVAATSSEEIEKMRATMAAQLHDFDAMKKKLMRDLQNRCERVVELEISLDEAREQYTGILRSSNTRAQAQKMAFLERNLEQLTNVQKMLVEQNSTLKKDLAVAERKLGTRNERIGNLEVMLQEAQAKYEMGSQRYEAQIAMLHEKLRQAQAQQDMGSNWVQSSRIAKPLRGGGVAHFAGEDADDT
ncbi:P-loop containing nucleoside triphosphate hydrolase protein [Entophlyctis helioformis]|nr:P-loop containing nucleoside triphosphate hydrolase protein [Entophlyctis helioformis]